MNRRTVLAISAATFIVLSFAYDNFYTTDMIIGTYVYDFPWIVAEGPSKGDKLILKENGDFESDTWGKGVYKLDGSRLQLNYSCEFGKAGFETSIYRRFFWGKPRISIERDIGYYFRKKD
ncbi:hypothetical protein ACFSJU_08760 [Paradesertivirga mongoliensis]|uniref:Uncharacterized protein n=1 Tax=Paradesertivirga mongoliensis TaxID=2100740 RepID=A0ABW4ZK71_9SPHI|nr:hypothetical protein [Pedobacter mongoliensis]